jgi:hypothetical protein
MLGDGAIEEIRPPITFIAIGVLLIIVAAIALGAIYKLIDSFLLTCSLLWSPSSYRFGNPMAFP